MVIKQLTTSEECQYYLDRGYALQNKHGYIAIKCNGKQHRSNPKRKRIYRFSNPQYWTVLCEVSWYHVLYYKWFVCRSNK